MTVNKFHVFALAATLALGGAMSAHAASDDQIKYRDGKPVGAAQGETAGDKAMGEKPMDHKATGMHHANPTKHGGKAMHGKKHMKKATAKGHHMKRKPSVKHLRGHSEHPRSRM